MSKVSKNAKLIFSFALIMLAFFCSFNVVLAYFTTGDNKTGSLAFSNVDVKFVYVDKLGNVKPSGYETLNGYTIDLNPNVSSIARGDNFSLCDVESGEEIQYIQIRKMSNTTSVYIRFWIDAYVYDSETKRVDTSVNYGKYFFFETKSSYARGGSTADAQEGSWCYFVTYAVDNTTPISIGKTLTFQDIKNGETVVDAIPNELLGSQLKISITLQAVQTAHEAFKQEFNDEKGYYISDYWK
ncbi:MAG: hypothetical protein IKY10_00760 [Clostridia bacterium]|nr:hypothetical protein [Clostridia bacterium]